MLTADNLEVKGRHMLAQEQLKIAQRCCMLKDRLAQLHLMTPLRAGSHILEDHLSNRALMVWQKDWYKPKEMCTRLIKLE